MIFVGDVHGKFKDLNMALIGVDDDVIQVGDLGIGFPGVPYPPKFFTQFRWLRGNHDNPQVARNHPNYLGDYGTFKGIYFIGGANSFDKEQRTIGIDWWPDEELSYLDMENAISECISAKPAIIVTHDCPQSVANKIGISGNTRTRLGLQAIFEYHKPKFWIFGHHHKQFRENITGTQFIGLGILEVFHLENSDLHEEE